MRADPDLLHLREALGVPSWDALAAQLGVSRSTVYRWVNGAAPAPGPVRLLIRLACDGVNMRGNVQ